MQQKIISLDQTPDIPIQKLDSELLKQYNVTLSVLRLDMVDEVLSGNKWFKLKYNLSYARNNNYKRILSFGGCYSNHLHALAAAGQRFGFETIGVVRGERPPNFGPTLLDLTHYGMHLKFVSRETYRKKTSEGFMLAMKQEFGEFYQIPEGGSNVLGVKGCTEIMSNMMTQSKPDFLVVACGSGATLAGVIIGTAGHSRVLGICALKGAQYLGESVLDLINEYRSVENSGFAIPEDNWQIYHNYHFGGFAKVKPELIKLIDDTNRRVELPLEPIYTGKAFYAIFDLVKGKHIREGAHVMFIHTGGLQGLRGMKAVMDRSRQNNSALSGGHWRK